MVLATLLSRARPAPFIVSSPTYVSQYALSKVEFFKRKPVFSTRFLVVGRPFHSHYLRDATDNVVDEDLNGEELWTAEGLQIPVCHTEDSMAFIR
jgi:hypothetical protein